MKAKSLILASVVLLGLAALPVATVVATEGSHHDLTVQFVSFDTETQTVTFKDAEGEQKTAPVMESAVNDLKEMKTGERVTLTCADDDKGEHMGVSQAKRPTEKKT